MVKKILRSSTKNKLIRWLREKDYKQIKEKEWTLKQFIEESWGKVNKKEFLEGVDNGI